MARTAPIRIPLSIGRPAARAFALALGVSLAACGHSKIPFTQIDDTEDNRAILATIEAYQKAAEARDAEAVLALVSPDYFENNGNSDESDDYNYEQLQTALAADFARTQHLRLRVRVDAIETDESDDNRAYAEVLYDIQAHNDYPTGAKWDTGSDRARLTLVRHGNTWRIVAGL